jgi:hypothetical protein
VNGGRGGRSVSRRNIIADQTHFRANRTGSAPLQQLLLCEADGRGNPIELPSFILSLTGSCPRCCHEIKGKNAACEIIHFTFMKPRYDPIADTLSMHMTKHFRLGNDLAKPLWNAIAKAAREHR